MEHDIKIRQEFSDFLEAHSGPWLEELTNEDEKREWMKRFNATKGEYEGIEWHQLSELCKLVHYTNNSDRELHEVVGTWSVKLTSHPHQASSCSLV
eukprot:scaffold440_cov277-Ochromonas_danica.AAC.14